MKSKLMIIGADDYRDLTFEEVFKMYQGLLNKSIKRWLYRYEYDDLFQVSSVALWRAYENYDICKKISFGQVAKVYIEMALCRHNQLGKPKTENKSSKIKLLLSFEDTIVANYNGEKSTIQDIISDDKYLVDNIEDKIILDEILKKLTKEEKTYLSLFAEGFRVIDVAKSAGIKVSTMRGRRQKLLKKLRCLRVKQEIAI